MTRLRIIMSITRIVMDSTFIDVDEFSYECAYSGRYSRLDKTTNVIHGKLALWKRLQISCIKNVT